MDHRFNDPFNIKSIALNNRIDPNEFFSQQREIDGILSSAFDDITSIQHLSDDEDGDYSAFISNNNNNNNKQTSKLNLLNGFKASTPLNNNKNNNCKTNGKFKSLNEILEEDTIVDVDSLDNDDLHSDLSLSDHHNNEPNNDYDYQQNGIRSPDDDQHYDLLNNDVQLKDLCYLKQQFAQINSNYEILQEKYQKLYHSNEDNVNTIELMKSKIKLLEKQLKDERNFKENEKRKTSMFESKVNSLEYQLSELQQKDYLSRNDEEQMKWFETLKLRHQKDLNDLRNDYESRIENLTKTIGLKDDELISNCNLIHKYKQEVSYFQNKMKTIENEMQIKLQSEIKNAKEQCELRLLNSFDDSMKKLKTEWEQKLQEDIEKIIDWFDNWDPDSQQETSPHLDVRFEKLINFCDTLKRSTIKREAQIQAQIEKMEDAKRQLEKALLESRLRNSSISSTSSRSDLPLEENANHHLNVPVTKNKLLQLSNIKDSTMHGMNGSTDQENSMMINLKLKYEKELKYIREQFESDIDLTRLELSKKEDEVSLLKHKSNKYKQHYQQMIEKHKQELSLLKNEFTKVIQNLMDQQKPT